MSKNYALSNTAWYFKKYTPCIDLLMKFSVASFIIKSENSILSW